MLRGSELKTFVMLAALVTVAACAPRTGTLYPTNMQVNTQQQIQQQGQSSLLQQLNDYMEAGHNECAVKYANGEYKTMVAYIKCYNSVDHNFFVAAKFQYMDLADLLFAKNVNIAKKFDQKKITLEEANIKMHEAKSQFITESQKRHAMSPPQAPSPQPQNNDPFSCQNLVKTIVNMPGDPATNMGALEQAMKMFHPQGC